MQAILEKIPKFRHRVVNIGLLVTAAIFLIILIICFATFGWVIDYKMAGSVDTTNTSLGVCIETSPSNACALCYGKESNCGNSESNGQYCHTSTNCSASEISSATASSQALKCDFSLEEAKCDGGTYDLDGDYKSAADVMIGLGAMSWIFICINLLINIVVLVQIFTSVRKIMTLVGLVLSCVTWLFLTCGWGHYADKKGGVPSGDVDYGASFAFVILLWLALFPYIFFWLVLWISVAEADANPPEADPKSSEPNSSEYPSIGGGAAGLVPVGDACADDGSAKQQEHSGVADDKQPATTTPNDQAKADQTAVVV